jgi:hypothetical protein
MTREEELVQQGWVRRMLTDEPRLSEAVEEYRKLGFEVRVEPVEPASEGGCTSCFSGAPGAYKVVYTRQGKPTTGETDNPS